jgi:hypothetical protein
VDRLARRAPDGAHWKALGHRFLVAFVALGYSLPKLGVDSLDCRLGVANPHDRLNLALVSRGSALDQRDIRSQAHAVDMSPGIHVVECIEDQTKALEPLDVEARVLDVRVDSFDLDVGVELARGLLRNLIAP